MNRKFRMTGVLFLILTGCSHLPMGGRSIAAHTNGKKDASAVMESPIAWVQLGPQGERIARAIVSQGQCPDLTLDSGSTLSMQVRVPPSASGAFPEQVCEASLPEEAKHFSLGKQKLTLPAQTLHTILVIGDTGCLVKSSPHGKIEFQDCNNPKKWPFAEVAKAAAQTHPDLVIHVGDYHYREAQCPSGNKQCSGSPFGDVWASWSSDFFTPAQPLLSAAPWIFVRGNHEICARGGEGFFRYLDPRPYTNCTDSTAPYLVTIGSLSFAVLDSSQSDFDASMMDSVKSLPLKNTWLLTHRPPWLSAADAGTPDADDQDDPEVTPEVLSAPSLDAVGAPSGLSLVIVGHRHLFRAESFSDHRAPLLISGNGGTKLESHPVADQVGTVVDGGSTTSASIDTSVNFGFMVLSEDASQQWSATVYDQKGQRSAKCQIDSDGSMQCQSKGGSGSKGKKK